MGIVVPWTEFVVRTYMYTYNIQDMSCAERPIRQAGREFASRAWIESDRSSRGSC